MDFVIKHQDKPWYSLDLSTNPAIMPENIEKHPELQRYWVWNLLSQNPNITLDFVLKHPDKQWCWDWNWNWLSDNPGITLDDIDNHPELPWNWYKISNNSFGIPKPYSLKALEIQSQKRIVARTKTIKEELMIYCWNPTRANVWWTTEGLDE
jgi:hypothetical protein